MTGEIEPRSEALDVGHNAAERENVRSLRSIAISLKRIADLMNANFGEDARNEYGETPTEAIGAGIARALNGVRR